MVKRFIGICAALLLALLAPVSAFAQSTVSQPITPPVAPPADPAAAAAGEAAAQAVIGTEGGMRLEQVQVTMPFVDVWFYLDEEIAGSVNLTASLGAKPLEVMTAAAVSEHQQATYFFLVDCSTSTTQAQMEAVKRALHAYAGSMGPNEKFTLITFGVRVDVVLDRVTDLAAINAAIDALAPNQAGTLFFDALAKANDLAAAAREDEDRKLAFIFSDSVDYNLGGYTREEVDKLLFSSQLPFYAFGFDTGTKAELDNFGALARASGGTISIVNPGTLPTVVADTIAATRLAYKASMRGENNIIEASPQTLTLTHVDRTLQAEVPVEHWQPDTMPPVLYGYNQESDESIRVMFSEPVRGAETADSYVVKTAGGDLLAVSAAAYDAPTMAAIITLAAPPAPGTLTVEFPGITDVSMEQNPMTESITMDFEGAAPEPETPVPEAAPGVPVGAWIFIGILAAAIIAAIAVAVARRKSAPAKAEGAPAAQAPAPVGAVGVEEIAQPAAGAAWLPQVHFAEAPAHLPVVTLHVTGPSGHSQAVEVAMNKTLFVGRSDICDVYFDDNTMSRQHFVIGEENGAYTVTNLSETGGTTLNGVPLKNPRPLQDGDVIGAGRQTLVFYAGRAGGKAK